MGCEELVNHAQKATHVGRWKPPPTSHDSSNGEARRALSLDCRWWVREFLFTIYLLPLLQYTRVIQTDKRSRLQPKSASFHTRLGRCFKSNFNTMAAKPPEPLGCITGFRCAWERSVLCFPSAPPKPQSSCPQNPSLLTKWGSSMTDAEGADTFQDTASIPNFHNFACLQISSTPLSSFATTQTHLQKR